MKTIAALVADRDLLLAGRLVTHRRGPEKGRPCLAVTAWCIECCHSHIFSLPDILRLDAAIGPVSMPCRGSPYEGRPIYVGLDPELAGENRRTYEAFRESLRRHETQRRLERQLAASREEERAYLRVCPDALHAAPPVDHLANWEVAGDFSPSFQPL